MATESSRGSRSKATPEDDATAADASPDDAVEAAEAKPKRPKAAPRKPTPRKKVATAGEAEDAGDEPEDVPAPKKTRAAATPAGATRSSTQRARAGDTEEASIRPRGLGIEGSF